MLMQLPGLSLIFDKVRQGFCVCNAPLTQIRISTNSAVDIVDGLPMPSNPDLPGRKIEV